MFRRNRKIFGIILIAIFIVLIIIKIAVFDNINILFYIAEGFDQPSAPYFFVQKKIYRLSEKRDLGSTILEYLKQGNKKHLQNSYIKALGVIGEYKAAPFLIKLYYIYKTKNQYSHTMWYIISSMGMIGLYEFDQLLEKSLNNHGKDDIQVSNYLIARSLYLITGKRFNYTNDAGEEAKIFLTHDLRNARKVIVESAGRKRTYDEMIILDKLYHPPDQ